MGRNFAALSERVQRTGLYNRAVGGRVGQVFAYRDFRLLWTGAFVSFVGSWIQTVAQGYLVYQITHDRYLLGLVSFFGMLPVTIVGPIAGSLTDTLDKRKLLVVTQAIFAAGALFLAAAVYWDFVKYWHIVVVALVLGTVSAIEMPTRQAIVSKVVPPEVLPAAIPLNALTFNLARLLGPAIGGMLLATVGPGACYLMNGLSFFALIFAGLAIKADLRATRRDPQPVMDLVMEGALYTFRRVDLRTLFILEAIVSVFGLFYITQIPAIAEDMLKLGKNLGYCYAAAGVGSVIGLVVVTSLSHLPMKAMMIRLSMTIMGISLVILGLVHSPWAAYPLFALLGMCAVSHFNLTNTLFQLLSPERLRGRVLSMHIWALSGLSPFGVYAFGFLAQKAGLPITLQVGGGCVLAGAAFAWLYRAGLVDVA